MTKLICMRDTKRVVRLPKDESHILLERGFWFVPKSVMKNSKKDLLKMKRREFFNGK